MTAFDWTEFAACRGSGADLFFPEAKGNEANLHAAAAREVCAGCPVRETCLDYALRADEEFGVWGGMSVKEREAERKRRGLAPPPRGRYAPIRHGTTTGYKRGCRDTCCRAAWAAYMRDARPSRATQVAS